ncbi:MAG: TfoX/Sxy family protein [Ferruginibacter sp.]
MAFNEKIANRIRQALADVPNVEEKRMFRGIAFMVNDKMCINIGGDEMMCRIDPLLHQSAIKRNGCSGMVMKGKELKGWIKITVDGMKSKKDFDHWIGLALEFNKKARSSKTGKA